MAVTPSHRAKARQLLLQALYQWRMSGTDISIIEAEFFADNSMAKVDTEYFRDLLHGIPGKVVELEAACTPHMDRKWRDLDPISCALLQIGAYELLFRLDIPYRVAINEAVNLAKKFGPTDAHKYVNGILDKVAAVSREVEMRAVR